MAFALIKTDYLMKVVRHIVHDHVEESLLNFKVLGEKIVINFNAARMVQNLNNLKLSVGELGILVDFLNSEFLASSFVNNLEHLSERSLSYGLEPSIVVCSILGVVLG